MQAQLVFKIQTLVFEWYHTVRSGLPDGSNAPNTSTFLAY